MVNKKLSVSVSRICNSRKFPRKHLRKQLRGSDDRRERLTRNPTATSQFFQFFIFFEFFFPTRWFSDSHYTIPGFRASDEIQGLDTSNRYVIKGLNLDTGARPLNLCARVSRSISQPWILVKIARKVPWKPVLGFVKWGKKHYDFKSIFKSFFIWTLIKTRFWKNWNR